MFAAVAVLMLLASSVGEIVETTRNLELDLKVIEAFEHGPVILDVTLTNRGKKPLNVRRTTGPFEISIVLPRTWSAVRRPRWCAGFGGSIDTTFEPGVSWTERQRLHIDYVSTFPPGTYQVEPSWLFTLFYNPDDRTKIAPLRVTKTFPVTISPATPANRWALATRLEAEFAALPPDVEGLFGDPLAELGDKLSDTPHRELIPLALRMMERVQINDAFSINGFFRQQMAEVVFRADPKRAHRLFVDRLLASPRRCDPRDVFRVWEATALDLAVVGRGYLQRVTNPKLWLSPRYWHYFWPEEELMNFLYWANYGAPCIMPANELKRLSAAKDFAVRAWAYSVLGQRLGREWCDDFLKEARQFVQIKPDPKRPTPKDPALRALIFELTFGDAHRRKLLGIFLAGAEDHWITKAAREELAEYEKQKQERKP
jgi:hypothetical protein